MDPKMIERYDGFVSFDGAFFDNMEASFSVSGVDNAGGPVRSFDLRLAAQFGVVPPCYLSLRCFVDNAASGFAEAVWWDRDP